MSSQGSLPQRRAQPTLRKITRIRNRYCRVCYTRARCQSRITRLSSRTTCTVRALLLPTVATRARAASSLVSVVHSWLKRDSRKLSIRQAAREAPSARRGFLRHLGCTKNRLRVEIRLLTARIGQKTKTNSRTGWFEHSTLSRQTRLRRTLRTTPQIMPTAGTAIRSPTIREARRMMDTRR